MLNSVCVIGSLLEVSKEDPRIRFLLLERVYSNFKDHIITDKIPIMNWNKQAKGEIFSLPDHSLVVIRGRIESLEEKIIIITESITNLGLKY